jgi:hypothetical protein
MKALIIFLSVLAVLVAAFLVFAFGEARADRRAQFINALNALREAQIELHQSGQFTNYSRYMTVYPYTNRVTTDGTSYQCEFAVECEDFTNRGLLTITTNETFVWFDKKQGVMPLGGVRSFKFPPGF